MTYHQYTPEGAKERAQSNCSEVVALSKYDLATCNQGGIRCDERGRILR